MTRRQTSPLHPTMCEGCEALIWFAITTANGRPMPLDAKVSDDGNVACYQDDRGTWHARVLKHGQEPERYEKRYHTHFETCTSPESFRRRYRKAQADLHRAQRSQRGRPSRQAAATDLPGMLRFPTSTQEGQS